MEKYSSYRDKGSGIAPFLPIKPQPAGLYLPFYLLLFAIRVPVLLAAFILYFVLLSWFPIGSLVKKVALWIILGVPGIWWVDLQVDGVRRGTLGRHIGPNSARLPRPGSVIASSLTSPIDPLYLAAIFDPVFTISYPETRLMRQTTLLTAVLRCFATPSVEPTNPTKLCTLAEIVAANPDRPVVVFPECTTTNGRAILPLSPSILMAPADAKIFPTSLRYSPADVTTPIPRSYIACLWNLCSRPTHTIRVRIAEPVRVPPELSHPPPIAMSEKPNSYATNFLDSFQESGTGSLYSRPHLSSAEYEAPVDAKQQTALNQIAESLARLGRVKRVSLGIAEKIEFLKTWRQDQRG